VGRKAGVKHIKGQNAGLENALGIDQKLFNVIFTLITGSPTLGSGHRKKMDIWDCPEGIRCFRDILFKPTTYPKRTPKRMGRFSR